MDQISRASQNEHARVAPCFPGGATAPARAAALLLLFFVLCAGIALFAPRAAYADSYSIPQVDINAQVETDGSLHVVEQRTFDFKGDFTAVWWTFDGLPSGSHVVINSVRMVPVGFDGQTSGYPLVLDSVPFVLSWRDSGGPGIDAYSFDQAKNTVYVFFDATDEQRLIELDYTVENGVTAYSDVGEVYWKFISDAWDVAADDVSMSLALPVPSGVVVQPGENVRAWGHGPADGEVSVNEDGTVTYTVPHVDADSFAEARVVFPVEWLTNLPAGTVQPHRAESHLSTVLSEEQTWADQANRSRVFSLAAIIACAVLCALCLCIALWAYFRHGKEHEPAFKDDYWRDLPDPDTHPALIGRLWRWNHISSEDFTATLMHLTSKGALRIEKGRREVATGKAKEDYLLTRLPGVALNDPLDAKAVEAVFDVVGQGSDAVWFGELSEFGKSNPGAFVDAMDDWQGVLSSEMNKRSFFEYEGSKWQTIVIGLAIALGIASIGAAIAVTNNFIPIIFAVPTIVGMVLLGNHTTRRSHEGNEICAKCKALRNWLRDFSSLDERPPTDVAVWGEFMVYAYLFGIADRVIDELRIAQPQLFEGAPGAYPAVYSWWLWYTPDAGASGATAAGDLLQGALNSTENMARSAVSTAMGGTGSFSSGIGAGGGFSMGGGGGFGAGGGAR